MRDEQFQQGAPPATMADASAAAARLAALGGLDLACRWRFRLSGPAMEPDAALALLAAAAARAAPGALARRARRGDRPVAALYWSGEEEGAPLFAAPGAAARARSGYEVVAAAVRFCDGVGVRLGLGRGAVGHIRRARDGAAVGALMRLSASTEGWTEGWTARGGPDLTLDDGAPDPFGRAMARAQALGAVADGRGLTVWLPAAPSAAAYAELIYAAAEAARGLEIALRLDGPEPPPHPELRAISILRSEGGDVLEAALGRRPGSDAAAVAAAVAEAARRGWRPVEATLTVGDAPGRAAALRARPHVAAHLAAHLLERPGLARALGAPGACDASPSAALRLDDALAAASAPGPDALGARFDALRAALGSGPLALTAEGGLSLRGLPPPETAEAVRAAELLFGAAIARAATLRRRARAPLDAARPRDAFDLPQIMWADFAAGLAELAAAGAPLSGAWFEPAFLARHPVLARTRVGPARFSLRRAAEPSPASRRYALLVEAPAERLLIDGSAASWLRCPLTGGMLIGLRLGAEARPISVRIDVEGKAAPGPLAAAILRLGGDAAGFSLDVPPDFSSGAPPTEANGTARPAEPCAASPFLAATIELGAP